MDEETFKRRTKQLALDVLLFVRELPTDRPTQAIAGQLLRSAMSIAANYRAACRGRSLNDVISKLGIVEEESHETMFWLEVLEESGTASPHRCRPLHRETEEILAMTVSSIRTLKSRRDSGRR